MSMVGELTFFLGLQITQLDSGNFLSQSKHARELVKKFRLDSTMHSKATMSMSTKLCKDTSRKDVEYMFHMSMIGSLLYLIGNCLDISFNVGVYG